MVLPAPGAAGHDSWRLPSALLGCRTTVEGGGVRRNRHSRVANDSYDSERRGRSVSSSGAKKDAGWFEFF